MAGAASAHWIKHVELLSGFDPDTTLGGIRSCGLRPEDGPSFPVRPTSHSLSSLGNSGLLPGLSGTVLPSYPKPISVTGSLHLQRTTLVSFEGL